DGTSSFLPYQGLVAKISTGGFSMLITRSILVLCAVAALLALPAGTAAQSTTLNGTATLYQVQGTAPTGAMLTVVLREFKSGAATSIATQTFPVAGKPA